MRKTIQMFPNRKALLTLAIFGAITASGAAQAQTPAPQLPGARPMPGPAAGPMPAPVLQMVRSRIAAPPEVENPPAPAQRLATPGEAALPMPDDADEREASDTLHPIDGKKSCPKTIVLKAPPPNTASPYAPDFPTTPGAQWMEPNFGGTTPNRHFRHTFQWDGCKLNKCCEVMKAKLVVTVKALLNGQSHESPNAGNDSISIWKNGTVQHWQYLYPPTGVTQGTVKTLAIPVQPSWLDGCRLSFQVQDDSSVLDAKLVVTGCCVKPNFKP